MQEGVGDGPFVFTGGVWVYGNTDGVVDENAPLAPPPLVAWRVENTNAIMEAAESGGRPVLVMPGGVYGDAGGLLMDSIIGPAAARGHASYIGDGDNHWALVHRHDIAQLYVLALGAPPRSRFCGVGSSEATMRQLAEATGSASAARSMSLRDARECFGPLADALALDQQFTAQHARDELGWVPDGPTPLEYLAAL
jgi:nucleoside-diphosphate-sugar epimerase